ncbi:hypothetical protein [Promicromonospora sp. NPDC060271]
MSTEIMTFATQALRVLAFATAKSPDLAAVGKNAACFVFSAARDRNA